MTILLILLLTFGSVAYMAYLVVPLVSKRYTAWHQKKSVEHDKQLKTMWVYIPKKKLMLFHVLFPPAIGVWGIIFTGSPLGGLIGAMVGFIIPAMIIKFMDKQRRKKFASQLVDGLMVLSGSLKAGLSLVQAIEALVEEMPAPISEEFGLVVRENRMGVSLEESLLGLKRRMELDELDMIVTSILVARETGGDLTQTFAQLVFTIRERSKIEGRVAALTVQGKMQGVVMSLLPVGFAFVAYSLNNHFFDPMLKDPLGQQVLALALGLEVVGSVLIMKFSKVKV